MMSHSFNVALIELVRDYEFLYQPSHKVYKDVQSKENAWDKIGESLGTTGEICMKRWKSLRDRFTREVRKIAAYKSQFPHGITSPESTWEHFDSMTFLQEYLRNRPTLNMSNDTLEIEPALSVTVVGDDESTFKTFTDTEDTQGFLNMLARPHNKRKRPNTTPNAKENIVSLLLKDIAAKQQHPDDHISIWGNLIAANVKRIKPSLRDEAMLEVQKLIASYEKIEENEQ